MTLLITVFAAILATFAWYIKDPDNTFHVGTLALIYWGAALMWLVDAVFEYIERKDAYFLPTAGELLNDGFLGFTVVAFGLIIWMVKVLLKDPNGVFARKSK